MDFETYVRNPPKLQVGRRENVGDLVASTPTSFAYFIVWYHKGQTPP
jgi:hypothetical protein